MSAITGHRKNIIRWVVVAGVVGGGAAVGLGAKYLSGNQRQTQTASPTFAVAKGPLTISVSEAGTVRARQVEIIKSEVEGSATILFLVPEGSRVKKGDLIFELDATKMQDSLITQQITVQNAEAAFINAREGFEVAKSQARSDIAKAELDYEFAKEDLIKYDKGDFPKEEADVRAKIALAEEDVKRSAEKLRWSKILFEEKYLSATELQTDEMAHNRAQSDLALAKRTLNLLMEFTRKRELATLNSNVEQMQMALERVQRKASADVVQAEAQLRAKKAELDRQKMLLEKNTDMVKKAKAHAPFDGLVVYATSGGGGGFRRDNEPIAEGQTVRERQEIIHLPTANAMMAEIKVHESSLSKVRIGLPVRVTVDAAPGQVFWGRVSKISQMPDQQSFWQNPDLKVYATEILLDGETEVLRTGMSCRAEVYIEQHQDAVYVPVQAIARLGGKHVVYIASRNGEAAQPREIELGLDNNRMARIISGVNEGEVVLLNPPLSDAPMENNAAPADLAEKLAVAPTTRPVMPVNGAVAPGAARGPEGADMPRESRRGDTLGAPGEGGGRNRGNLTPEQIEERRKRFEAMTPEEREKMAEQFRRQREQRGEGAGGPGGPGGPRGGAGGGGAGRGERGGAEGGTAPASGESRP